MSVKLENERTSNPNLDRLFSDISASDVLKILVNHLIDQHNFSQDKIQQLVGKEEEILIPVSVFTKKLSSLEIITRYLHDILGMKNSQIAKLLNRNVRTIWTTYANSLKKSPEQSTFDPKDRFFIPISKFTDRTLSTLEVIVKHLREYYNLGFHEIALMLKRDDSTIWTVYKRAKEKVKT